MKNNETKELKTKNSMYLLKMDEVFSIRGGDNYDGGTADMNTKDEIFE